MNKKKYMLAMAITAVITSLVGVGNFFKDPPTIRNGHNSSSTNHGSKIIVENNIHFYGNGKQDRNTHKHNEVEAIAKSSKDMVYYDNPGKVQLINGSSIKNDGCSIKGPDRPTRCWFDD